MSNVFKPGENCWRVSKVNGSAMLIDCANFYRALHNSIVKAQKSIFIVGWDIDSRIRLLRGLEELESSAPSIAGELLAWKARQNPKIKVYLLRWDSSLSFFSQREFQPQRVWEISTPDNVHVWLDNTIPCGGSHHQKIVLIDDEIAFTGGMDISCGRWDERDHRIHEPERTDDHGPYKPYHDIQIVSHGPIVKELSELVRWRWRHATGYDALPFSPPTTSQLPQSWPEGQKIWLSNIDCAIARTIPWMGKDEPPAKEVHKMYFDLLAQAENFLYVENQFFSFEPLAVAINKRLKQRPNLRVLMIGPWEPKGIFEREGLWAPRIDFKKIVEEGVDKSRIRMVYPWIKSGKEEADKRIHSKLFCVDDKYLTVASSNLTRRSMSVDTESDVIFAASTPEHRKQIAHVRNDLLAEHTTRPEAEIAKMIDSGCSLDEILSVHSENGCRLIEMDDTKFTDQSLQPLARPLADPDEPLLPSVYPLNAGKVRPMRNPRKDLLILAFLALLLIGGGVYALSNFTDLINSEHIRGFLDKARGTPGALPLVCLIYVVGGLVLFPVTGLSLITTAVFGAIWGPIYAMCGALCSAAVLYGIGQFFGMRSLRNFLGERVRSLVKRLEKRGVMGIVVIRMTPVAPYTLVNLASGIVGLRFFDYIVGTFLGLLPGLVAKGFVGESLVEVLLNPTSKTFLYVLLGIIGWLLVVWGSQRLVNYIVKQTKEKKSSKGEPDLGVRVPCR